MYTRLVRIKVGASCKMKTIQGKNQPKPSNIYLQYIPCDNQKGTYVKTNTLNVLFIFP